MRPGPVKSEVRILRQGVKNSEARACEVRG